MISVVIPTRNRHELLAKCMRSIVEQAIAYDSEWEIIIVDNGSTDNTREYVNAFIQEYSGDYIRYIYEAQKGVSIARNIGVYEAKGDIVAFIDDDALALDGWLNAHLDAYFDGSVGCVCGSIDLEFPDIEFPNWFGSPLFGYLAYYNLGDKLRDVNIKDQLPGACNLSFRKNCLMECGGFNQRLTRGEDTLACRYLLGRGKRIIYTPNAKVRHFVLPEKMSKRYFLWLARESGNADSIIDELSGKTKVQLMTQYLFVLLRSIVRTFIYAPLPNRRFYARLTMERAIGKCVGLYSI